MPLKSAYYEKNNYLKVWNIPSDAPTHHLYSAVVKPHTISTCFPNNTDS